MNPTIDFKSLIKLDAFKQNTFAYLTAKRALPTSTRFCDKYGFGNREVFENAISILQRSIFGEPLSNQIEEQLNLLDINSPATNDFPTHDGAVAEDCGGVFFTAFEMLLTENRSDKLDDISTLLTNAFDAYVVSKNNLNCDDENFEEIIASNPQMLSEINAQNGIISYLKSKASISQSDVEYLIEWQEGMLVNLILD